MSLRTVLVAVLVGFGALLGGTRADATFPGTPGRLVFASERDGNSEIYSMNPDGSDLRRLTQTDVDEANPKWSPEANRIAYDRELYLHVMNAEGTANYRVHSCYYDVAPAWSPEGNHLAFVRHFGKIWEIGITTTGGQAHEIIAHGVAGNELDSSPDGSTIVFEGQTYRPEGTFVRLQIMNSDGSDRRALAPTQSNQEQPSWSPDSRRIAFASDQDGNKEIYVIGQDGSELTRLTNDPAPDYDPAWSPDGSKIAFVSERDGNAEIYMMNADGSDQTRITQHFASDGDPDWQATPTSSEVPPPTEGPTTSCDDFQTRSISLWLTDHLEAHGRVTIEEEWTRTCGGEITVERKTSRGWQVVSTPSTWPRYQVALEDRPDKYRARVPRQEASHYTDRTRTICVRAVSPVRTHTH